MSMTASLTLSFCFFHESLPSRESCGDPVNPPMYFCTRFTRAAGTCSVAGEPVSVEAKPLKRAAAGAWVYRLNLFGTLSARFVKLRGELGSAVATVRLSGPEGDAKLLGVPVAESLELGVTTLLRFSSQLAPDGVLSGRVSASEAADLGLLACESIIAAAGGSVGIRQGSGTEPTVFQIALPKAAQSEA